MKLAAHLAKRAGAGTLYIFDEPATRLHFDDINKLLAAFRALIDAGGSLLVIEHNLDVIKTVDYIIDLGPEGGNAGGHVVATGTPEEIMSVKESHTGRYLKGTPGGLEWQVAFANSRPGRGRGSAVSPRQSAQKLVGLSKQSLARRTPECSPVTKPPALPLGRGV